jgi:hypothetical protein
VFKVEFFIDDRRLGDVLRLLAGSGARDVIPVPVVNAEVKPNGQLGAHLEGSSNRAQYVSWLKAHTQVETLTRSQVRDWYKANGKPDGSANMMKYLAEIGVISKSAGTRGSKFITWKVNR